MRFVLDEELGKRFLERALAAAIDLPADERAAYVEEARAGDPELLADVKVKLGHIDRDPSILKTKGLDGLLPPDLARPLVSDLSGVGDGQMLSHYRLTKKIGEGGMGVVWQAADTILNALVAK